MSVFTQQAHVEIQRICHILPLDFLNPLIIPKHWGKEFQGGWKRQVAKRNEDKILLTSFNFIQITCRETFKFAHTCTCTQTIHIQIKSDIISQFAIKMLDHFGYQTLCLKFEIRLKSDFHLLNSLLHV